MKTSVRAAGIKSINNNRGGLGASELHGKRLDTTSQKRIITAPNSINWSKAGENNGLDLVAAFKAHKKETGAVERGNAEIGTHLLVVVPPEWIKEGGDIHDPNNPNTLKAIQAAKEWAESWQGEGAVFAYRFDLDEKGTGVIDLFTAPVFEQGRRNGKTVKTISPSMAKRELVKRTGEKTSGAAFQTSWAEWAETHLDTRMERGNRKAETGREHVHAEIYAKAAETLKAEIETEFEVKKVEENDRLERIRAAKEKQLEENYAARQKQLEENYAARQKQLEDSYEAKKAELDEKIADKTSIIATLDKREADLEKRESEVEANEAKKLKLFNKTQVIQDKLEELEHIRSNFEGKYQAKAKELEAEYDKKFGLINEQYNQKHFALDKRMRDFENQKAEAKKILDQGFDFKKVLSENEKLKSQLNSKVQEYDYKLDRVKYDLNAAKSEIATQTKTIEAQITEINKLKGIEKVVDFIDAFLKQHFPTVHQKLIAAWKTEPAKSKTEDYDYSGPSM